jgi:hypothetical protein
MRRSRRGICEKSFRAGVLDLRRRTFAHGLPVVRRRPRNERPPHPHAEPAAPASGETIAEKITRLLLPPLNPNKAEEWEDSPWNPRNQPTQEELANSVIGRATLELFRANQTVADGVEAPTADNSAQLQNASQVESKESADNSAPVESTNPILAALSWPPRSQQTAPPPKPEEEPRDSIKPRYVAGIPPPPDKSLRPISDWNSDANNNPIY